LNFSISVNCLYPVLIYNNLFTKGRLKQEKYVIKHTYQRLSLAVLLDMKIVQRWDEDKHHLLFALSDIVPDAENDRSKSASERDSIFGIHFGVLFRLAGGNKFPVDDFRINSWAEFDKEPASPQTLVTKAGNLANISSFFVSPCEDVFLSLRAKQLDVVISNELPDQSKDKFFVAFTNIFTIDANLFANNIFGCTVG